MGAYSGHLKVFKTLFLFKDSNRNLKLFQFHLNKVVLIISISITDTDNCWMLEIKINE